MRITVVGMGKIGLPLAVQYARKGHQVIGTDINQATVDLINSEQEPFPGEAHLAEYLAEVIQSGNLSASINTAEAVSTSDAVVVVVPLFVDKDANPDFGAMDSVTRDIARGLKAGTLVSYETTLPVGTTRTRLVPMLEEGSGLKVGQDFYVVFSPERVLTGRVFSDLRRYPKLVGGIEQASEIKGIQFYTEVLEFDVRDDLPKPNGVWSLGSAEAAELAKLAETTYRDVNIGLANQFALFAEKNGINFTSVAEACNSQPYSHIHKPGIAVGGHCIPVYPRLYLWNDPEATVVRAAREVNATMPEKIVSRIEKEFGSLEGVQVVILGASYRGGVKETAFSGVFPIVENLKQRGAKVSVHDSLYAEPELLALGFNAYYLGEPLEIAIIQTDHLEYKNLASKDLPGVKLIVDGRNILDPSSFDSSCKMLKIGIG